VYDAYTSAAPIPIGIRASKQNLPLNALPMNSNTRPPIQKNAPANVMINHPITAILHS
jgi:hypothetical protein